MTLELKRPVLKSNCSIFCTYKLFLRMPCLQPLLKVFISDPQAKWSEYFILCFGSGDKLHKNGFWKVWMEKAGGSSLWPGAQGEARLRGCGRWPGEGHLLQGIVRIPQERRMEPSEELHLGVQTKLLRAGVNGTEEGRSVLELEVWTELPEWVGWRVREKVTRKRPCKRNPARNMQCRQQGTECGRKQNPSNLLSFWATDESGETGIQSSTKKGSKASNEMEGIMLSGVRNQACVFASAQPGRAQDGFAVSNGSKIKPKTTR